MFIVVLGKVEAVVVDDDVGATSVVCAGGEQPRITLGHGKSFNIALSK